MVSELDRRYAKAYVNIFTQYLTIDFINKLDELVAFLKDHKNSFFYLTVSSIPSQIKYDVLMRVVSAYALETSLTPIITLLKEHKRLSLAAGVLEAISDYAKEYCGIVLAHVQAYPALSVQQTDALKLFLEKKLSKKVRLTTHIDKSLIAGIRVSGQTFLFERSIAQQVRRIVHDN